MTEKEKPYYEAILQACKEAQDAVNNPDNGHRMTQLRYLLAGVKRTRLGVDLLRHQQAQLNARVGKTRAVLPPDPAPLNNTPVPEDIVPEVKPKRRRSRKKKTE